MVALRAIERAEVMTRNLARRCGLLSNVDDPLKNHGFLYVGSSQWALSPLFDVNPAPERFRELKTAIADPTAPEASIELLLQNALFFELKPGHAVKAVKNMARMSDAEWRGLASHAGMTRGERDVFERAFVHAEASYALAL